MDFSIVKGAFTIHRLSPDSEIPEQVLRCSFFSISRTDQELSIVCPSFIAVNSAHAEAGWSCLKVLGPLDFSLTGILANISGSLAKVGISLFAISTYDTDYILVKSEKLEDAIISLQKENHTFID